MGCLSVIASTASALAQGGHPVGHHAVAWPNPLHQGSTSLFAEVRYPAVAAGVDMAPASTTSGWPVIVFLHGYGAGAGYYHLLADTWAAAGYVVVLSDTSLTDWTNQPLDGIALYAAVRAERQSATSFFRSNLDLDRIAIAGHSMGGASVGTVLANNPGYACGFAIAPATPLGNITGLIDVPFGMVAGLGDWVTPPALFASAYYAAIGQSPPFRFFHLLDSSVDHASIVALGGVPSLAFEHTAAIGKALFDHCFGFDPSALDVVAGPLQANPMVQTVAFEATRPLMWTNGSLRIGQTTLVSIAAQPGLVLLAAAANLGPATPTQFGNLLLDQASTFVLAFGPTGTNLRADLVLDVPNDPSLDGLAVALQGSGASTLMPFELGNAALLHVTP